MNRTEKIRKWYLDTMMGTTEQCIHELLQNMRNEINRTLNGIDEDGTPCSDVRTESNLCQWLSEQLVTIESILRIKEELDNLVD